jgi:hypothetical protein
MACLGVTIASNCPKRAGFRQQPFRSGALRSDPVIAAEIAAGHTDMEAPVILQLFAKETGYATPKVDVRGAVFLDNAILLVRERDDGLWTLPGGWVDVWESPSEAVVEVVLYGRNCVTP